MSEEKKYVTFRDLRAVAKPEPKPEVIKKSTSTSIPSTSSTTSKSSIPSTASTPSTSQKEQLPKKTSVAPERDFQRIPNSVTRQALPEGLFRGKSKQVWDYLWSISRGAIAPIRFVRKSRREIKAGAGLGSMVTVDAALEHLARVGLINVRPAIGSPNGNEYEVFTPEEIGTTSTSTPSTSSATSLTQKVDILDIPESSISSITQSVDNKTVYGNPKTSFKTSTDDDDTHTLAGLTNTLLEAARGVGLINSDQERERWNELGRLLADELKEAAQRTDSISSVPAFLTAHLRRRLARKPAPQAEAKKSLDRSPNARWPAAADSQQSVGKGTVKAVEGETQATGRSKFSLEECRRYADHLHSTGQGITNPGGFAMTIYRSGISDALIQKFLDPAEMEAAPDSSACPDCKGTGFYYPHGEQRGVVKCRHEKLSERGARQKLTMDEITERVNIIGELLESGYTIEQAEIQFAQDLDADDWALIRTRLEVKKTS